jgi:hypothetical protein
MSVVVPMPVVGGVPMAVMDVIDVVLVRHGDVTAVLSVLVVVPFVDRVCRIHALVHMVFVGTVQVAVVRVVDVVVVRDRHVAASRGVLVSVRGVGVVRRGRGHLADSFVGALSWRHRTRPPPERRATSPAYLAA